EVDSQPLPRRIMGSPHLTYLMTAAVLALAPVAAGSVLGSGGMQLQLHPGAIHALAVPGLLGSLIHSKIDVLMQLNWILSGIAGAGTLLLASNPAGALAAARQTAAQ